MARLRRRAPRKYKPRRQDAIDICRALYNGHCRCADVGSGPCREWWWHLKATGGDVEAVIAMERQGMAADRRRPFPI